MSIRLLPAALLALAAVACGVESSANINNSDVKVTGDEAHVDVSGAGKPHLMPVRTPGAGALQAQLSKNMLTYYGGKVIPNAAVYNVNWGGSVNSQLKTAMPQFYQAVMNSAYIDWLAEYDTSGKNGSDGQPGSNQRIGHGTLAGDITISPSITSTAITDTQIQQELDRQISAGVLPAPDDNAFYAINFPKGVTIDQGGSGSCQVFCAYHGTFTRSGQNVYYSVIPSMEPGTGCDTGCGTGSLVAMTTSVASHELIEAITDGEVGIGTTVGRPLAWYNSSQGEIGDICNGQDGTISSGGTTWTVQKEYDNATGTCIVSKGAPANDFSVALSPSSATLAQGGTATFTVNTAAVSGTAQAVTLAVSGFSAGLSGSLSATSVTAGGSATLTVTASSTAAVGSSSFTLTGTATSGSHSASGSISVTSASGGETVLTNGVPLTGRSGAKGAQSFYKITVPTGASNLNIAISGGTGDANLYTRFGSRPSLQTYDCRPNLKGNGESCSVPAPQAGTYYVMLNGYAAFSGVSLVASFSTGGTGGDPALTNGVPVSGLSGAKGSSKYYQFVVPPGSTTATFTITGSTSASNDVDLYVQFGAHPTTTTYACRSWATGSNETCTVSAPRAGTYYLLLSGYTAYSGATLKAQYQ